MNIFSNFLSLFREVNSIGINGNSIIEILFFVLCLLIAFILRGFFANIIVKKLKKIVIKTGTKLDDNIFEFLIPPLQLLPIVFIFLFLTFNLDFDIKISAYIEKINKSLITIFIFWFIHQLLVPVSVSFNKLEEIFSKALVLWLTRSLRYIVIFLGAVGILETWGIKIGPIIAGLGLFGVAVALGAQDFFKNLISGISIIFEKNFNISDVVEIPGHVIGTVEHIGFRSTLIRKFDSTPVSIPNYIFSETSIINLSQRPHRRIKWIVGLTYDSSVDQLKEICSQINDYISNEDSFMINETYKVHIRVEKFNDSSIDLLINVFTKTNSWDEYIIVREKLLFEIKKVVESSKSSFAFPSSTIYLEKN